MKRFLLPVLLGLLTTGSLHAQQTKSTQIVQLFRDVVAKPSQCTVRVTVAGKETALGTIVSADGWILTKHSELKDGKIACILADNREFDAELVGFDAGYDLAMLKIDAEELTPVTWSDSKVARVGHWVASPGTGKDPVAIGVLSVQARPIKGTKYYSPTSPGGAYFGAAFDLYFPGAKVEEAFTEHPAYKAGLRAGDEIRAVNGNAIESLEDFRALLAKHKPDDVIKLKIVRADTEQEFTAKLTPGPGASGGKSRSDVQNNMGSKFSARRGGFPIILQHDSVLKPTDCGGPLCNLEGQVIGINIARAGRTESYAIPSEAVRPLLEKLKTAKKVKTEN